MPVQETQTLENNQVENDSSVIIEVSDLFKSFRVGEQDIEVLKGLGLQIRYGDFAVIFGPSGCGKSTFLHILLGLEPPTSGMVKFLGQNLYENSDEDTRAEFRKRHVGMVYQQANWVKSLTVQENVAFPLMLLGIEKPQAMSKAYELLRQINMSDWGGYIPTELSGGQQQRVSLARALVNNPEIIIADEPTGNLDYEAGQTIMALFTRLNKELGKTVIMVTHDLEYLTFAKTAVQMLDGHIIGVFGEAEKEKLYETLKFKRLGEIKESADAEKSGEPVEGEGENPSENPKEETKENPQEGNKDATPNESPEKSSVNSEQVKTIQEGENEQN